MRLSLTLAAASALFLAGCSQAGPGGSDAPITRAAGSWKNSITINELVAPGAPPEAKQMMQSMMQAAAAVEVCITPEYTKKVTVADELANGPTARDCNFSKKDISGGNLTVEGVCKGNDGKQVSMAMNGTVSEKKTSANITVTDTATSGKEMKMAMTVVSEWTGECKPGQPNLPVPGTAGAQTAG
jgi:hypothetical protein